ncbi:hypothetical protein ACH427_04125 [Streptomyces sp. NPDC020379]|uniref:hypothetical protein n=1 Tax=Streptomyces sp. NPDC020379 TaxID=3365071 RepID=UPI00379CB321
MTGLAIGQLWMCKDPRRAGRTLKITAFDHEHVHAVVTDNTFSVRERVRAGYKKLDKRGHRTTILTRRFSADLYRLLPPTGAQNDSGVLRLPQTCTDYGPHTWTPIQILGLMERGAVVRLVCTKCYAHTQKQSAYVPASPHRKIG